MALMEFREPNQVKWMGSRPGHNGAQKLIKIETAVPALLYTVSAGTTFFLTSYFFGITSNGIGASDLQVRNAADAIQYYLGWVISYTSNPGNKVGMSFPFPIEIPAGWDFYTSATLNTLGFIAGWEE